jgi:hypothetical protein
MDDAARPRPARRAPRGFSFPALLLTLLVCLALAALALLVADRTTKILPAPVPAPALKSSLAAGARALTRDLSAAAAGLLPPDEAVRPLSDNFAENRLFTDVIGQPTVVRLGTDVLEVRGVLRSPVLRLEAGSGASGTGSRPSAVSLRIPGSAGPQYGAVAAAGSRLLARGLRGRAKRFFVVRDAAGAWAVARIAGYEGVLMGCDPAGGPPQAAACYLNLTLDFTDPDAVRESPGAGGAAASRLGAVSEGGLFDVIAFFVAQGPAGRPPDYVDGVDPPSLSNPHPYLAAAEAVGQERWEVARLTDDIENLQVSFGYAGAGSGEIWTGDRAGSPLLAAGGAPEPEAGRSLEAVRCVLVAVGSRLKGGVREDPAKALPFNAPPPSVDVSPIGWSPDPRRRVAVERESRLVEVRFPSGGRRPGV